MTDARKPEVFMKDPTAVFSQWLVKSYGMNPLRVRRLLRLGRLAMAMEIITVVRVLEQHSLLIYSPQETISVLQTLLNDQDLSESAYRWYEMLAEWRKPISSDADVYVLGEGPSGHEALGDVLARVERRSALLDSGRSLGLPSSETPDESEDRGEESAT